MGKRSRASTDKKRVKPTREELKKVKVLVYNTDTNLRYVPYMEENQESIGIQVTPATNEAVTQTDNIMSLNSTIQTPTMELADKQTQTDLLNQPSSSRQAYGPPPSPPPRPTASTSSSDVSTNYSPNNISCRYDDSRSLIDLCSPPYEVTPPDYFPDQPAYTDTSTMPTDAPSPTVDSFYVPDLWELLD